MDFFQIKERCTKNGVLEVYPDFKVCRSKDLMVRGKAFYAIWDEEAGMWSTDEYDVQRLVDRELLRYKEDVLHRTDDSVRLKLMSDFSSSSWISYRNYVSHVSDNSHQLDECLTFSNTKVKKKDYVSKRVSYPLEKGDCKAYDEIIGTLYDQEEREKLEWAIGSVVSGDSRLIQKFIVLYGDAGAGKSTILNIIQKLFEGYYTIFEAKALTTANNSFATEVFKSNPLVAIQHDGDLSRIEDNTKINSIVSHEEIVINEKYKSGYAARANAFLFMATNRPVKITDAKSGIIRRLIDVKPSGNKIPPGRYQALMSQIDFELGAIAQHCLEIYQKMGRDYYNNYIPFEMIFQTDVFFNFVEDSFDVFQKQDAVTLKQAYAMYKEYCDEALVDFKLPMYKFRSELKNYFEKFEETKRMDGKQIRSYYSGFRTEKFSPQQLGKEEHPNSIILEFQDSLLDEELMDCPAQYASKDEIPLNKWAFVLSVLSSIDTRKLHYVKVPLNHIVIDFDLKDENGEKSLEKNLEEASKWPATYAELSKGEHGIHLHYIYDEDPLKLSRVYKDGIEIKVFNGDSSLRRKLTKCNNVPIAHISSGLPLKEEKKMIDFNMVKTEKGLRDLIERNLKKEIHPGTKPSIDFIYKILEDAYATDLKYDVSNMRPKILAFANNSTHQSEYCVKLVSKMKFMSKCFEDERHIENHVGSDDDSASIVFFDVEVFPNLFLVNWKYEGDDKTCVRMINPSPQDIEELLKMKLVGFNNRRYDNHILYARYLGYSEYKLFELSQGIITGSKNCMFGEAYNLSYTDVYDFCSKKQSLKKWEIELGIHHKELGLPWDQPVPEEKWIQVAEYCDNDIIATEAVFHARKADFVARQILSDLAGMTVNDTTNSLTTKIIFGNERNPQKEFHYRDLSKPVHYLDEDTIDFLKDACPEMMSEKHGEEQSILPYFPGYKYECGKSTYKGVEVGEGGRVYAEPGMYTDVALLDIMSMHPHSAIAEVVFGVRFTKAFREIVYGRVSIKHESWEIVNNILDGMLSPYIEKVLNGELETSDLAYALKIAINSVYGLTSAKFDNPFRDPRNVDNIVAKRGALFMIDLQEEVQKRGFTVAHVKTDSIKVPNATPEIIQFIMDFGKRYGYTFEHEATYSKMCLVNDAVYIAKYKDGKHAGEWTATGVQFQVPYVFKTLFSKEPIEFKDLCETKSVTSALYLDMNEDLKDVSEYEKELEKVLKKGPESPRVKDLRDLISEGHSYQFVGKVGLFCPMKPGTGGGWLVREKDGKYYSATGAKGYRWMESEIVKEFHKEDDIDRDYYNRLVDQAVENISQYGDFEWFVSDDDFPMNKPEEIPWADFPCGGPCDDTSKCLECPHFLEDEMPFA